MQLNPWQQTVVGFRNGFAVCVAAPGSGKTAVIVERIRRLRAEGVPLEDILSLTFTKEGALEMSKRAGLKDTNYKLFTTFHSWALAFIKEEALALPFQVKRDWHGHPNPLCLPLDAARTLAQIVKRISGIQWKDAGSYISACKRRGISPNEAEIQSTNEIEEKYIEAYRKYDDALRTRGLMDFDSIMIEAAALLEKRADVRGRWQKRYVQVDEAQDTDSVQWRIVKAISEKHGNVLAVGDENQGMYSWRGSESNLTEYFLSVFSNSVVMPLPINYRSTGAIINYCKEIAPIKNETIINLSTENEHGVSPDFRLFGREDEEAKAVIGNIMDLSASAILARTNRQLAAFEDECSQRNLRYKLLGKSGFWSQREVKDVVAILASVVVPSDNNILRMLISHCDATKYLRKTEMREMPSTITLLKKFQEQNQESGTPVLLHKLMQHFSSGEPNQDDIIRNIGHLIHSLRAETHYMNGKDAMQAVVDRFGILSFFDVAADDEDEKNFDNDPRDNVLKLVEYSQKHPNLAAFYDYTQRVRKATLARSNYLTLSTIHQAKGKEWQNVYVVGVNDGILPHIKGDESEERRIYFVACSRAAKRLWVSANGVPSELIRERLPKEPDAIIPEDPWANFQLQQE